MVGIAASTVATVLESRGEPGCPAEAYGCAEIRPGQAIRVGLMTVGPGGAEAAAEVSAVLQAREETLLGHRVVVAHRGGGCTAEAGAEAARDLTDPPADASDVVGSVGLACPQAMTPAAQILSDAGQVLVAASDTPFPGAAGDPAFFLSSDGAGAAAEAILEAVGTVAVWNGDDLLVPRTDLRDALLDAGLGRAA